MKFKIVIVWAMILATANPAFAGSKTSSARRRHEPYAVTVYKQPTCGCCLNYIAYLAAKDYKVTVVNFEPKEYVAKKRAVGVPAALDSCHTTLIEADNYFVEGHVPYEAINKLLAEKPDIRGIGLAGMPSASPGMPGGKTAPFAVKQVSHGGAVSPYVTL